MNVNNLSVSIEGHDIIKNVTFTLNSSDKVGLVGINGSGKSTLLKILAGEIPYDNGNINYLGQSVGYLKQEIPHAYDKISVLEYLKHSSQ